MSIQSIRRPTLYALFALFVTVIVILTAAIDAGAQSPLPRCPQIDGVTLVDQAYTATKTKCWYAGPWDVFQGYPGYSPYFFCNRNQPVGMIVYNALETPSGTVKCVWTPGSETPEGYHAAPDGFRSVN